jgi:glutamate-ammonia-ligase adenylyltransferase
MNQPSLTELARYGFVELGAARDALNVAGLDATSFAQAASPDKALSWVTVLFERAPQVRSLLEADVALRDSLIRVVGASDGLAEFLTRVPDAVQRVRVPHGLRSEDGYRAVFDECETSDTIRRRYREELLSVAAWDLADDNVSARLHDVAAALADLAAGVLEACLRVVVAETAAADDVSSATSLAIIGMGKAGARELNYVSDVDVIFVADSTLTEDEHRSLDLATKWAKGVVAAVNEPGIEPPLWELDANLRPEGAKGALVRTLESHVAYYERWAEHWEFQALLKARPMAGDPALGARYLDAVRPFIWGSSSRDGFVDSVQRMRERVTANIPVDERANQIKLGPGGLRDVEFTVQLLQLVHGKDDERVRARDTLSAIAALAAGGYVGRAEANEFAEHYRELRVLEHRVQLLALRRTHLMPQDDEQLRVIARSSGLADSAATLLERWSAIKREVRTLHEKLFYRPLLATVATLTDDTFRLSHDQAEDRLRASGFRDPSGALRHLAALTSGISRTATIHRNLLPVLLHWMSEGADPDGGLAAFRNVSESLGDSPWFLRLLRDSAGAAQRLSAVLSASRFVALLIERVPDAVAWLDNDAVMAPRSLAELHEEFGAVDSRHDSVDDAAKAIRFARRRELLRLALASVLDLITIEQLGVALADLTTATITALLELARRGVDGIEFGVIAMGRYGGAELGFSSDADVVWVFRDTGAGDDAHKRAERIVHEVVRLAEDLRFPLDIDAGLRPEGKNGPLVRSLDAYRSYYEKWSDVWETQALVRARPVAGDVKLLADFESMADSVRYASDIGDDGIREIRRIKARVETERMPHGHDPNRHTKLGRGSLSDVEWLVQLIQLQHGATEHALRTPSTLDALDAAADANIVSTADRDALRAAWLLASRIRSAVVLATGKASDIVPVNRLELEGVARILGYGAGHSADLENDYLRTTRLARQVFERLFFPG